MPIHKRVAQLCVVAIFLVVVALLHQHGARSLQQRKAGTGHVDEQQINRPSASSTGTRWPSLSRWMTPYLAPYNQLPVRPLRKSESDYTRIMVVPRMKDEDISWIAQELPDANVSVYIANDPSAPLHPPKNKGHEVMIYLTYIIDHYDELPDVLLFMHAHRYTHHNNELLGFDAPQMIKRLSSTYVIRQGYVNMRCHWSPGCPEWLHPDSEEQTLGKQEEAVLTECWSELFPLDPIPKTLSQPCCAQFALSRDRIHSIPLNRFIFFRDWTLRTPLSDYVSGRIWEYSWQYLFTGQSVSCPAEHLCYCGGFGVCFGGATEYSNYGNMRQTKLDYEAQIADLRRQVLRLEADKANTSSEQPALSDKFIYLREQVKALEKELAARRKDAIVRGDDPRKRAEECNWHWAEDDGF